MPARAAPGGGGCFCTHFCPHTHCRRCDRLLDQSPLAHREHAIKYPKSATKVFSMVLCYSLADLGALHRPLESANSPSLHLRTRESLTARRLYSPMSKASSNGG